MSDGKPGQGTETAFLCLSREHTWCGEPAARSLRVFDEDKACHLHLCSELL